MKVQDVLLVCGPHQRVSREGQTWSWDPSSGGVLLKREDLLADDWRVLPVAPVARREFNCPTRVDQGRIVPGQEFHDFWREERSCSYCGSLHPDLFMDLVIAGAEIEPTDKNYKAYVRHANGTGQKEGAPVFPGGMAKFYYNHLSLEQQERFVGLLNSGDLNIGFPGHFYCLPYFVAPVGHDQTKG